MNSNTNKRYIVVSFKVDQEFYDKYLRDVENRSEFIRYAIESLYQRVYENREYETLIDVINSVGRWKLRIWRPYEENARGRYVTYEIISNNKYKLVQRYIRLETLHKINELIREVIEEIVINQKRDSEKIERKFGKKVIDVEI